MATVILYRYDGSPVRVPKSKTHIATRQCSFVTNVNEQAPDIYLSMDGIDLKTTNYMYIDTFGRYYWIRDNYVDANGTVHLVGKVDVLETVANELLGLPAVLDKVEQPKYSNRYLDDGSWINENRSYTEVLPFANGFNENGEFILITAGGGDYL